MTFKFILGKETYLTVRYDISIARGTRIRGITNFTVKKNWIAEDLMEELSKKDFKESTIELKKRNDIPIGEKKTYDDAIKNMNAFSDEIEDKLDDYKDSDPEVVKELLNNDIDVYFGRRKERKKKKEKTLLQFIDYYCEFQKGIGSTVISAQRDGV